MPRRRFIGELLIDAGLISRYQLDEALELRSKNSEKQQVGDILVDKGYISLQQLQEVIEFQLGIPYVDLNRSNISLEMASVVPVHVARRTKSVPVKISGNQLHLAMVDPLNLHAIEDVQIVSKLNVLPLFSREVDVYNAIDDLYGNVRAEKALEDFRKEHELEDMVDQIKEAADDTVESAPIVRLLDSILEQAVHERASDIHIEPTDTEVRIRIRVDGLLIPILTTPLKAHSAIITRIKIIGNINIAEKRLPQDGRSELQIKGRDIDIRISTLPTVNGEKAVLRLLDRTSFLLPKEDLGFTRENLDKFNALLKNPYGIILVTGPTGSGKSTTLYTMLSELNTGDKNIITVEDPVEYMIQGLNQVQVNHKAGLDFANGLRSILRQDPDIIMIGEIRDQETADIAIRAAVTGHLVLSTLHTNNASGTVSRLLDMGVEPYMLSAALMGVISQRLVKKICPVCKTSQKADLYDLKLLGLKKEEDRLFYQGTGCANCNGTGYKGRIAAHEMMMVNSELEISIPQENSVAKIQDYMDRHSVKSLKDECIRLALEGVISLKEAIAVAFTQD